MEAEKQTKKKTFTGEVEGDVLMKFIRVAGEVGRRCVLLDLINAHERRRLVPARTAPRRANTSEGRSWCESFRFARLPVSDLMTLHIFSSSSNNKNSLFWSCLDGGRGRRGRNRDPIQGTEQHDCSLERALSPSSE